MSAPARQRSLRERIQSASRGIGISWQGKKSKSCYGKESLSEAQLGDSTESQNEKSTNEQPDNPCPDSPAATNTGSDFKDDASVDKKPLGRTLTQPQGTEEYKVAASDTLNGIAARFDTTPSELAKLNRLGARMVFPGQVLFVPEKRNRGEVVDDQNGESDSLQPPQNGREDRRPSVTDALRIPYRRASERAHRFLKVKARHFTDGQGVVSGVLIITPNAVMFDPNVSDSLVIEHGVESYGVIAPIEMLMRTAIYFDIAHMKVQNAAPNVPDRPKAEVYYGKFSEDHSRHDDNQKEEAPTIEIQQTATPAPSPEAQEVTPAQTEQSLQQIEPTEKTNVTQSPTLDPVQSTHPVSEISAQVSGESADSFDEEVSDAFASTGAQSQPESRRERMLKRLSYPMESITSISRMITSSPKHIVELSGSLFSGKSGSEEEPPDAIKEEPEGEQNIGYQNLVEEKPEIFEALDKLLKKNNPEDTEGPPLYLCLRMGIPKVRKPQPSPVLSYGKKRARSEYWFSIPRSRVEDLYNFLQQWIPALYGEVDDVDPDEAGFTLIDDSLPDEPEEEEEEEEEKEGEEGAKKEPRSFLKLVEEHFGFKSISPGDWEVLSLGEMEKVDYSELELPLPDLLSPSEILTEDHIKELYTLLPARAVGFPWTRVFSTASDGFHLRTLYRKMTDFDSPIILLIQDCQGAIFGALLSYPLRQSDSFYGTGESFLFTFHPAFKVYRWTGENDYFVKGSATSVSIGASEGRFGLWFDAELNHGATARCQTFDNDPLASSDDFIIKTLEAWGFA